MDSHGITSEALRVRVKSTQLRCESLTFQFEAAALPSEKTRIADQYSHALKQLESLQLLLELVERQEKG